MPGLNQMANNAVLRAHARHCWRKRAYRTYRGAAAKMLAIMARGRADVSRLDTYQCNECGQWHLGRLPHGIR